MYATLIVEGRRLALMELTHLAGADLAHLANPFEDFEHDAPIPPRPVQHYEVVLPAEGPHAADAATLTHALRVPEGCRLEIDMGTLLGCPCHLDMKGLTLSEFAGELLGPPVLFGGDWVGVVWRLTLAGAPATPLGWHLHFGHAGVDFAGGLSEEPLTVDALRDLVASAGGDGASLPAPGRVRFNAEGGIREG